MPKTLPRITVSSQAASAAYPLDHRGTTSYMIGVDVDGTLTYSVQYTNSDIQDASVTPVWANHDTLYDQTADGNCNLEFVPVAVRLNVSAYTSGSATMTIVPGAHA